MSEPVKSGYAPVNGLQMYYEVHGTGGVPLLLMHGGMTTISDFYMLLPIFAESRQVVAIEQQGHGHTADIDRPFSLDQMADDTADALKHLGIEHADVFGYSTGGTIALGFALRHPKLIRKLVVASALYNNQGYAPGMIEGMKHATAADMPPILQETYAAVAPHPENWEKLVEKSMKSAGEFEGWSADELGKLDAPTLVVVGDRDIVTLEHATELYRMLPNAQLSVLPGGDHVAWDPLESTCRHASLSIL